MLTLSCRQVKVNSDYQAALEHPKGVHWLTFDSTYTEIPKSIKELTELVEVVIDKAQVRTLPSELYQLPYLKRLRIKGVEALDVADLIEGVAQSSTIEDLYISGVSIDSLESRSRLLSVRHFIVSDAGLKSTVNIASILPNIEWLSLEGNPRVYVDSSIRNLQSLKDVDLSNCNLEVLPENIVKLRWLRTLLLRKNNSIRVDSLRTMLTFFPELQELSLDSCDISEWPIDSCENVMLSGLSLAHNNLTIIPDWIGCYQNLFYFDLTDNRIRAVPEALWRLPGIRTIHLRNNQIETMPTAKKIPAPYIDVSLHGNPLNPEAFKEFEQVMDREGLRLSY